MLGARDWQDEFHEANLKDVDDFVKIFERQLHISISNSLRVKHVRKYRTCDLPQHLIVLAHKKHAVWREVKQRANFRKFRIIRNKLRTSIKRFYFEREKDLLCNGDRNVFYNYVIGRLVRTGHSYN